MKIETLIESYVDDVTRRLPRRKRGDVASELSSLLAEEIAARAAASGRPADEAMALALLRGFGRPAEVATRYGSTASLLDPADTRDFTVAAVVGALVLLGLGQLTLQNPPRDWATITVLSWLGFLFLLFASLNQTRIRWPATAVWRPRDRDRAYRAGSLALVAVIILGIVAYGAPTWLFAQLTGGGRLTPQLAYADDFQATRLPWLLGVWGLTAMLMLWIAIKGRWNPITRWIEASLQAAVSGLLVWFLLAGPMFQAPALDHGMKSGLLIAIAVVVADTVMKLRRLAGPPRPPGDFAPPTLAR